MEDNNDMLNAFTLETPLIGETGREVSAICGNSNDIMQGDSSKAKYKTK